MSNRDAMTAMEVEHPCCVSDIFRRMRKNGFLAHVATPAGPDGHEYLPIFDNRRMSDKVRRPRNLIDVKFHYPEIRNGGAEMRAHEAR